MPVINDRTPNKDLALPHVDNMLEDDVARLRSALTDIDADLHATDLAIAALPGTLTSKADLVGGKVPSSQLPAYVDDVVEYANLAAFPGAGEAGVIYIAIDTGNTYRWSGSVYTLLQAAYELPSAGPSTLGGIKVGSGLTVGPDGTLSTVGGGSGSGLPVFGELTLIPSSNGQTVFVPAGGYSAGQIELFLNGVLLLGNGDDYTATNGTTITLTVGANTTDTLFLRRWIYLPEAQAVAKTGDTMTGALNWAAAVSVASAATCNIGLAASNLVMITGSVGITSFGSVPAGVVRSVTFAHGTTIAHNSSSLILPGGANITAAPGDTAEFESAGSGAWRCTSYQRASGAPVVVVPVSLGGTGATSAAAALTALGARANQEAIVVVGANTTAERFKTYILTATLTLTLPASPAAGDWVAVCNRSGVLTCVVGRNGQNIMGLAEDMTLDHVSASITLIFADATRGWVWA